MIATILMAVVLCCFIPIIGVLYWYLLRLIPPLIKSMLKELDDMRKEE